MRIFLAQVKLRESMAHNGTSQLNLRDSIFKSYFLKADFVFTLIQRLQSLTQKFIILPTTL